MRIRGAAIQGGLAAIGLLAAYTTWQRAPASPPGEVVVLDVNKGDVSKIRFEDGKKWVEIEQQKGASGPEMWMRLSADEKAKKPERMVRGNDGAEKLFAKFAPLMAARALGPQSAAKLKELGLDAPKKKLAVTARGDTHTFVVGTSPFNVSEPYVMDERDKHVYVLTSGVISDLDAAAIRLVDRSLHAFKPGDYDALTLSVGKKSRELVVIPGANPFLSKLASQKTPSKPDEMAKNWHDKLWRLYLTEILGKGEKPEGGEPQIALKVEYRSHGKTLGFVEIGRGAAPAPTAEKNASMPKAPTPPAQPIYARSEHTAGWVKLPPTADDLIKEADKIASGE